MRIIIFVINLSLRCLGDFQKIVLSLSGVNILFIQDFKFRDFSLDFCNFVTEKERYIYFILFAIFSPVYQITVWDILQGIEVKIFSSSLSSSFHSLSLCLSLSLSLSISLSPLSLSLISPSFSIYLLLSFSLFLSFSLSSLFHSLWRI